MVFLNPDLTVDTDAKILLGPGVNMEINIYEIKPAI